MTTNYIAAIVSDFNDSNEMPIVLVGITRWVHFWIFNIIHRSLKVHEIMMNELSSDVRVTWAVFYSFHSCYKSFNVIWATYFKDILKTTTKPRAKVEFMEHRRPWTIFLFFGPRGIRSSGSRQTKQNYKENSLSIEQTSSYTFPQTTAKVATE